MLLNSGLKDQSLKDFHEEYAKYILGKWGLYSHKKMVSKYITETKILSLLQCFCHIILDFSF